jgi:glycosyltransferase involved in cell wall biosynthesis
VAAAGVVVEHAFPRQGARLVDDRSRLESAAMTARPMKIVQAVGWYHPDSLGGTEIYVASLASQLRRCGHEVVVAAPDSSIAAPRVYEYDGCSVFRYPIPQSPTREETQGSIVRGTNHFHRWLADQRADVVHFHTFVTGLGLPEIHAAKDAGSRVIVTTHASSLGFLCQRGTLMLQGRTLCDGIVDVQRCAACALEHCGAPAPVAAALSYLPPPTGAVIGRMPGPAGTALGMTDLIVRNLGRQRAMLAAVDAFVVLTERAAGMMLANGSPPAKIVVNRLGITEHDCAFASTAARVNGTGRRAVRVGYVGRFEDVKGVADLAEAIRRVPPDLPLRVEFRGPAGTFEERQMRADIERMFASERRVTVGDAIAPADVQSVLRTYDVLCCPSRCLEGGPTVGLEALAAGVPLIAASAGGVAEVLEDGVNARLVPPGDVDRLADALVEVASDPAGTIGRWKERLPVPRTMRDVTHEYLPLYAGQIR